MNKEMFRNFTQGMGLKGFSNYHSNGTW